MTDQAANPPETTRPTAPADDGAALERSAETIREAKDAGGTVAANDDITSLDDQRAGVSSEDPDGEGGAA